MPEENYSFAQTRTRLEDIVAQVRKKDVSLEKSLDLLEEGVRLANQCTELIDHADWEAGEVPDAGTVDDAAPSAEAAGDVPIAESDEGQPESAPADTGTEDHGGA